MYFATVITSLLLFLQLQNYLSQATSHIVPRTYLYKPILAKRCLTISESKEAKQLKKLEKKRLKERQKQ